MKNQSSVMVYVFCLFGAFFGLCNQSAAQKLQAVMQDKDDPTSWMNATNIYEVNVRQYTPEGTLSAFAKHLPRLKEMGVEILWLMPIYPVSETKRKGTLGSYYAVSDFRKTNPNFGTMEDFDALVKEIHGMDMKIILDWVPNHTGWDHTWLQNHPDWYTRNSKGEVTEPLNDDGSSTGWTDVADLNYGNADMRLAMIEDMKFWLTKHDIDGFRCDMAMMVPDDFWQQAVPQLKAIKPIYMLAESDRAEHRNEGWFDTTYGWPMHHMMNDVAQGKHQVTDLKNLYIKHHSAFRKGSTMYFTSNHDENSWSGSEYERMGDAADAMAVFAFTIGGTPLMYSGQEAGLDRRLAFFEKDSIDWSDLKKEGLFKQLLTLKKQQEALSGGFNAAGCQFLTSNMPDKLMSYRRSTPDNQVMVLINMSAAALPFQVTADLPNHYWIEVFSNKRMTTEELKKQTFTAWEYQVWLAEE